MTEDFEDDGYTTAIGWRTRIKLYVATAWCRIIDVSKMVLLLALAWLLDTLGWTELLFLSGVACLAIGVSMIYVPAAWICVGVVLLAFTICRAWM